MESRLDRIERSLGRIEALLDRYIEAVDLILMAEVAGEPEPLSLDDLDLPMSS